ncbi:MAG TPA: L-2-hydroxyglutarate oxidase [Acidimicrobiales bacterium]|nr:L-2-hydroxyglutarate oxidase [Acidimicrobiales bacterium]
MADTPRNPGASDRDGGPSTRYDVAVVGAGIVGLAVARELVTRRPGIRLAVLEREERVGVHQTGHNSGVVHSGVYYRPGSLKARLCTTGAALMYEFCDEHGIRYERCGKLIVALSERELAGLDELEARGRANGVPGLRRVRASEIAEIEPGCRGLAALHSPATGIVDYSAVARALERELGDAGVEFHFGRTVEGVERGGPTAVVRTSRGEMRARFVVGCAGLWSDRLAVASGAGADPRIVPFRGAYLTLRDHVEPVVRGLVYPVPDPDLPFLGVHVTRHVDGRVTLGPTALLVLARDAYALRHVRARDAWETLRWPGSWRMARTYWRSGVDEVRTAASRRRLVDAAARYVPAVASVGVRPGGSSGVRAQALRRDGRLEDDFVLAETPGAFHVRNAPSPAATSSLALARELVDRITASSGWRDAGLD